MSESSDSDCACYYLYTEGTAEPERLVESPDQGYDYETEDGTTRWHYYDGSWYVTHDAPFEHLDKNYLGDPDSPEAEGGGLVVEEICPCDSSSSGSNSNSSDSGDSDSNSNSSDSNSSDSSDSDSSSDSGSSKSSSSIAESEAQP